MKSKIFGHWCSYLAGIYKGPKDVSRPYQIWHQLYFLPRNGQRCKLVELTQSFVFEIDGWDSSSEVLLGTKNPSREPWKHFHSWHRLKISIYNEDVGLASSENFLKLTNT